MNILITGANGFVGRQLTSYLLEKTSYVPRLAVRAINDTNIDEKVIPIGDISLSSTNWQNALKDCHIVIHLAARVHVLHETLADPLTEFRRVNTEGTVNLAKQAAICGVKRFIFLSTIKVNGEQTELSRPFCSDDVPAPSDPYAISKYEAEQALQALGKEADMEIVIIRSPLVYGCGVKGNFRHMIQWVKKGIPFPLGAIRNKRSFVSADNLSDLIVTCMTHPKAGNQIFLISDGEDLSTPELLIKIGQTLGKPIRLLPIPCWILNGIAYLMGKKAITQRLCASLQIDIHKTKDLLGWQPPVSVNDAFTNLGKFEINL